MKRFGIILGCLLLSGAFVLWVCLPRGYFSGWLFVRSAGIENLAKFQEAISSKPGDNNIIPVEDWPGFLKGRRIINIQYHMDGILIVLKKENGLERGVYVLPVAVRPESGSGVMYWQLANGAYWTEQKVRHRIRKGGP